MGDVVEFRRKPEIVSVPEEDFWDRMKESFLESVTPEKTEVEKLQEVCAQSLKDLAALMSEATEGRM